LDKTADTVVEPALESGRKRDGAMVGGPSTVRPGGRGGSMLSAAVAVAAAAAAAAASITRFARAPVLNSLFAGPTTTTTATATATATASAVYS
jgi:hypothetical protein